MNDDVVERLRQIDEMTAKSKRRTAPDPPPGPTVDPKQPRINVEYRDLGQVTAQAWRALGLANNPPRLFQFGGVPIRIEQMNEDATPVAQPLTEDRMSFESAQSAYWHKPMDKGRLLAPQYPPMRVMKNMLADHDPPLPHLISIVRTPVFAPDGTLQTRWGYHAAGRTYFSPAPGFELPPVPRQPTKAQVAEARELIVDELLGEFPFVNEAERANAVALFLDPYIRNLISGPTPLRMIEAPTPGSGKGLLADVVLRPAIGSHINIMPAANDDDEWRKRITAQLVQAPAVILIDNLTRALNSGSLAAALTTTEWSDRLLGSSTIVRVPVRCVWIATANNPTMSTELARRTVRIRLDPMVDRPWQRTGFKHEDLRGWVDDQRPRLVWAALTIVQAWVSAGRPLGTARLGSYEHWAAVHDGILAHAGIKGFLGNVNEFYEVADIEGDIWRQFIALWVERFGEGEVGVADLFSLAVDVEGFSFGRGSDHSQRISFGRQLGKQRDRVIGDYRIVLARTVQRLKHWRLIKARTAGEPMAPFDIPKPEDEAGDDRWTA